MKKYLIYLLLMAIPVLMHQSCKKDTRKTDVEKIVNEWTGKTIQFPGNIPCTSINKDTVCPEMNTPYKILLYTDSMGCTSCKLQMQIWSNLIKEAEDSMPGELSFLFYFQPKNERELQFLFKGDNFSYPVYIDKENKINAANKFPSDVTFQCFLLDKDNKVVMIGNPTLNPKIWELYKQNITGKRNADNTPSTTIEIEQSEIELTNLKARETTTATFTLKNTGKKPLLIKDISASCGCTVPEWDKKPIMPGEKTEIKVKVTPDNSGYFRKTVTVFCNTKEGSTQLVVKSMVKS